MARSAKDRLLDAGTGLLLLGAVALLFHERVLPALGSDRPAEVGETLPSGIAFGALASGDTVTAPAGTTTLLLVLQSTCPACRAVVPAWTELLHRRDPAVRVLAVTLETPDDGLAYVRAHLPRALAVRPLDSERFLRTLQIRAVPTTLVVGPDRTLLYRRSGLLDDVERDRLLGLVHAPGEPVEPDAHPSRTNRPGPR